MGTVSVLKLSLYFLKNTFAVVWCFVSFTGARMRCGAVIRLMGGISIN